MVSLNFFYVISQLRSGSAVKRIKGGRVVIAGLSSDVGKALAVHLAKIGCKLTLIGQDQSELDEVKERVKEYTNSCETILWNDRSQETLPNFLGRENIIALFNDDFSDRPHPRYFTEGEYNFREYGVLSSAILIKHVIRIMRKSGGYIINIGSVIEGSCGAFVATYAASKAFMKTLSNSLHFECANMGIHVEYVEVEPSFVRGDKSGSGAPTFFIPSASRYAKALIKSMGTLRVNVPFYPHIIVIAMLRAVCKFLISRLAYKHARCARWIADHKSRVR